MQAQATVSTNKRSNSSGSKRRLRFLMILVLCFMSWAGVTIYSQIAKLHAKSAAVTDMEQKLAEANTMNEGLKKEIDRLHDDEYLGQIIRRDFHYTKTGETQLNVSRSH
ncbi:FtsB family cell division protein [Paenibacillus hexagrammi]|uniref:Septum formation initiator family protein n=1 Tax=Paenibacillus hexagrammi TaxID=2908839 RepID=A0ABY3SHX7_9BACL|nr:septum formation initiator family protein [Paenibacillus sp. YPD9-1]UJF33110.1 septum formation initiator family protein [Paenibacillus sp. YPD9-1]